jgi:hypothetical protein
MSHPPSTRSQVDGGAADRDHWVAQRPGDPGCEFGHAESHRGSEQARQHASQRTPDAGQVPLGYHATDSELHALWIARGQRAENLSANTRINRQADPSEKYWVTNNSPSKISAGTFRPG